MVGRVGADSNKLRPLLPTLEQLRKLASDNENAPLGGAFAAPVPRRIRRRISPSTIDEIVRRYESGQGTPKLCEEFGISKPSMLDLLHERGVQMRRQSLSVAQRARVVQLYEQGVAIKPIAEKLGSSFGTVHRVLVAEGIRLRPRPGR